MRVALINEGIYPYRTGAVGTWCHRLVRGLPEHEYHVVALVDSVTERLYPPLASTPNLTTLRVDGPPVGPPPGGHLSHERRLAMRAAVLLCRGMLDDSPHSTAMFRAALHRIVVAAANGTNPLAGISLPSIVLDAWSAARGARPPRGERLPNPTMAVARITAGVLDLAMRPLAAALPTVDLYHSVNSGLSILVALAAKWRMGIPYVLTEHSGYTTDPLLRRARTDPAVRVLVLRFLRALARVAYLEAAAIVTPSEQMRRLALDLGAPRDLVTMIPPGVDLRDNPPLRQEPVEPVMAWVGPDRERALVLRAFETVREEVPDARLLVIGHAPDGTRPLGVSFTGPVANRRAMYGMAQVIAISGSDPGMPYPLIEAMTCGRPAVCTESGGLADMVGIGAVVVPAGDPEALGRACVGLLQDVRLRRELSNSARQRARTLFSLRGMLDGYQKIYAQAVADRAESHGELVLSH